MEDAHIYMISTEPAVEGLFKLLNEYGWHKMRALAERTYAKTHEELEHHTADFNSVNVAREAVRSYICGGTTIADRLIGDILGDQMGAYFHGLDFTHSCRKSHE